jgi:hypothetical protein
MNIQAYFVTKSYGQRRSRNNKKTKEKEREETKKMCATYSQSIINKAVQKLVEK